MDTHDFEREMERTAPQRKDVFVIRPVAVMAKHMAAIGLAGQPLYQIPLWALRNNKLPAVSPAEYAAARMAEKPVKRQPH